MVELAIIAQIKMERQRSLVVGGGICRKKIATQWLLPLTHKIVGFPSLK